MDITRGSLDDITRPASMTRHRPGSRVSLNSFGGLSSPMGRPTSVTSSLLEILPPDPDILLQQDNDLALVEYLSSSEEEDTTDRMNGNLHNGRDHGRADTISRDDDVIPDRGAELIRGMQGRMRSLDLVLAKTDSQDDGSDTTEDYNYLTYISPRQETSKSPNARSSRSSSKEPGGEGETGNGEKVETEDPDADLAGITDPELRKALKKMRKLDRILSDKVTREREVKRQRKLLHHQLEVELEGIREEGGGKSKEASENTTRYLSLVPPPRHDEGVYMEDIPSTPVFATQVPDGSPSHRASTSSSNEHSTPERKAGRRGGKQSKQSSPRDARNQRRPRPPNRAGTQSGNADSDNFIQRNIELASDAGNLIAMTDDEKKRLEDLLQDVDVLAPDPEEEATSSKLLLNSVSGIGYTPDTDSQKLLKDIDEKLKNLLPTEDFTDICSTPSLLGDRRGSFNPEAFDLGERLLKDTKGVRTQQQRLMDIDFELASLQDQVDKEISAPSLSSGQLNSLLQRCSEASDRTIVEIISPRLPSSQVQSNGSSPRSPSASHLSPRPGGGEGQGGVPPPPHEKLSDDTLQQLLSEAKASLGMLALENAASSRASSRTATVVSSLTTGRGSAQQLAMSLGDSPRSEMSLNTSRSLVSHDMIQELLRNPRATMLQSRQHITYDQDSDVEDGMEDDQLNALLER